ncbi:MAG TPA: hypothetical protein PLQ67_00340, partial [Burkholderiaceae bacterium]|nr:hypothetical protein [Burkholderiaceae bacterium]
MMRWVNNLKMWQKFALLGLMALAMILPSFYFLLSKTVQSAQLAAQEAQGIKPAADALKVMQLTQQHRALAALFLSGNDSVASRRQERQAEVSAAVEAVIESSSIYKNASAESLRRDIASQWRELAQDVSSRNLSGPQS